MNDGSLLEQVLEAWRVNNAITLKLVDAIPKEGFDAVPLASRGRSVAKQRAHHAEGSLRLAQIQWRTPLPRRSATPR